MGESKPKKEKPRALKYDDKLAVNGSFMDIMKAAVKDANSKPLKKK